MKSLFLKIFLSFWLAQALIVAFILAFLPYVLFRGPVNRIARFLGIGAEPGGRRLGRA